MRNNIFICFLGIDGSGKSTLANYLLQELNERGYEVSYIWWLEGENTLVRRLLRLAFKGKNVNRTEHINVNKRKTYSLINKGYIFIILFNYLLFGLIKTKNLFNIKKSNIIILDRYYYDTILALSSEFKLNCNYKNYILRIYDKLLRRPDLIFIIDVPPEVSFSRKNEDYKSLEYAKHLYESYKNFYPKLNRSCSGNVFFRLFADLCG